MSSRQRDLDQNTLTDYNFNLKTFSRYSKVKLKSRAGHWHPMNAMDVRVESAGNGMASAALQLIGRCSFDKNLMSKVIFIGPYAIDSLILFHIGNESNDLQRHKQL
jgi:hypothetical protein